MKLKDFLSVLNMQIEYVVTDKYTKEEIDIKSMNRAERRNVLERTIYMVFPHSYKDNILNIYIY